MADLPTLAGPALLFLSHTERSIQGRRTVVQDKIGER